MKATKFIALIAFAGFGLCAGEALAQGNDDNDAPPKMSDVSESETEVTESYNETVTIDNNNAASTSAEGATFAAEPQQKERLRVYSGKHDGNNVIYDPRQ